MELKRKQFILKIGNTKYLPHPLQLLVDFEDKGDYWFIEAKKLKFKFNSTNKNIEQSQYDFLQLVVEYLEHLFNKKKLLLKLEALGFILMPEQLAIMKLSKENTQLELASSKEFLQPIVNKIDLFENLFTDWKVTNSQSEIIV